MKTPDIVYVTYIAATAERVWQALIDPEFTKRYFFGRRIELGAQPGEPFRLLMEDGQVDCQGRILEYAPPRRLSVTWHVEWIEEMRALPECVVSFDVKPMGDVVCLMVTQSHPDPIDEKYLEGGRTGWPIILCGIKTLLETGKSLPQPKMGD